VRKTADSHAHNGQAEASRPGFETTLANVFPLCELVRKLLARLRKHSRALREPLRHEAPSARM
jgi:hypothetical protein